MLEKLFSSKKSAAAVPSGQRIYAIGDIHGCYKELSSLLALIDADHEARETTKAAGQKDEPSSQHIIFLGDYVDRGPESQAVIETLLALKQHRANVVTLKGNHEAAMLDFLDHPEDLDHWLNWGGEDTLRSYGISPILGRPPLELSNELKRQLPKTHEQFLRTLPLTHQAGDYFFVHAGIRPGIAIEEQKEEDLLWIRKRFQNAPPDERPDRVIVHGHDPVKKPVDVGWRIAVDTGACWTGTLCAVVLEGTTRRFITT